MRGDTAKCTKGMLAERAFTLLEFIVVISIIALIFTVVGIRIGTFQLWDEGDFTRKLSETLSFLHEQAVSQQTNYRLEFDFKEQSYRVGVMRVTDEDTLALGQLAGNAGTLTLELTARLNPPRASGEFLEAAPEYPSLFTPQKFPTGMKIVELKTVRGSTTETEGPAPFLSFSSRGVADFAVLHLARRNGKEITLLLNPFTGNVREYEGYRDFDWNYGAEKNSNN